MKSLFRGVFIVLLVLPLLGWCELRADEVANARRRIEARLDSIAAMKDRGILGENNRGFVEARAALSESEKGLIAGENRDRAILYAGVSEKTGKTAEEVGRLRARRIAQNSRPGVWLQDESGRWYRK